MFNSPQTNVQTNRALQKTSAGEHLGLPASGTAPQTDAAGADPQQGSLCFKGPVLQVFSAAGDNGGKNPGTNRDDWDGPLF